MLRKKQQTLDDRDVQDGLLVDDQPHAAYEGEEQTPEHDFRAQQVTQRFARSAAPPLYQLDAQPIAKRGWSGQVIRL